MLMLGWHRMAPFQGIFLDLIESIPSNTWQSVLYTLICMAAVCFLFLNSVFTVIIASSCV